MRTSLKTHVVDVEEKSQKHMRTSLKTHVDVEEKSQKLFISLPGKYDFLCLSHG